MRFSKLLTGGLLLMAMVSAQGAVMSAKDLVIPPAGKKQNAVTATGGVSNFSPGEILQFDGVNTSGLYNTGNMSISLGLKANDETDPPTPPFGTLSIITPPGIAIARSRAAPQAQNAIGGNVLQLEATWELDPAGNNLYIGDGMDDLGNPDPSDLVVKVIAMVASDSMDFGPMGSSVGVIIDFQKARNPQTNAPLFPGPVTPESTFEATVFALAPPVNPPVPVPESGTAALLLFGGLGLLIAGIRRRSTS